MTEILNSNNTNQKKVVLCGQYYNEIINKKNLNEHFDLIKQMEEHKAKAMQQQGLTEEEIKQKLEALKDEIKTQAISKIASYTDLIMNSNIKRSGVYFSPEASNAFVTESIFRGNYSEIL